MPRLYLESLTPLGTGAWQVLDAHKRDLDEGWTSGQPDHRGRNAMRRRYVAGMKHLDKLAVALGAEPGRYVPLDPDTRPMALDRS